jgi:hypothetical protein
LTSVAIPDGVTSIDRETFYYCESLISAELSKDLTSIGERAFYGCRSLTSVVIPEGVTSIGESAFESCYSLTSVVIPGSVTSVGDRVFCYCDLLEKIFCGVTMDQWMAMIFDCEWYDIPDYTFYCSDGMIRKNGGSIFYSQGLEYREVPNGDTFGYAVVGIGSCTDTHIVIPHEYNGMPVIEIAPGAFLNCEALIGVTIPETVTTIQHDAFSTCNELRLVEIPKSVKWIGEYAFYNCSNLTDMVFSGTTSQWSEIQKDEPWYMRVPVTEIRCFDGAVYI